MQCCPKTVFRARFGESEWSETVTKPIKFLENSAKWSAGAVPGPFRPFCSFREHFLWVLRPFPILLTTQKEIRKSVWTPLLAWPNRCDPVKNWPVSDCDSLKSDFKRKKDLGRQLVLSKTFLFPHGYESAGWKSGRKTHWKCPEMLRKGRQLTDHFASYLGVFSGCCDHF